MTRDVTERVRIENQIREANRYLLSLNAIDRITNQFKAKEKIFGVLSFMREQILTEREEKILISIGYQLGTAIENNFWYIF